MRPAQPSVAMSQSPSGYGESKVSRMSSVPRNPKVKELSPERYRPGKSAFRKIKIDIS